MNVQNVYDRLTFILGFENLDYKKRLYFHWSTLLP